MARVRMPPPTMTPMEREHFKPKVGDSVEVAFCEEGEMESWWEGRVDKVKGEFYVVSFPDEGGAVTNEVSVSKPSCTRWYGGPQLKKFFVWFVFLRWPRRKG